MGAGASPCTKGDGPKLVTVDGSSSAGVLGHWSGLIEASKGSVVHQDVLLTCPTCVSSDAGVPDSSPDSAVSAGGTGGTGGSLGTSATAGTGGRTGGMTGLGGASATGGVGGAPATGGTTARGGTSASGGSGSGGRSGSGGATGTGGVGGRSGGWDAGMDAGDQPCVPAKEFSKTTTNANVTLDTKEAFCFRVEGNIRGWECSNATDRTLSVNGVKIICGAALPRMTADGWYYFDCSAGSFEYAAVLWWR